MKKLIAILVVVLISSIGFSQNGVTHTSMASEGDSTLVKSHFNGKYIFAPIESNKFRWEKKGYDNSYGIVHFDILSYEVFDNRTVYHLKDTNESRIDITFFLHRKFVLFAEEDALPMVISGDVEYL